MNIGLLVLNEFVGRGIIAVAVSLVVYNMTNLLLTYAVTAIMIMWMFNPLIEYKTYGG